MHFRLSETGALESLGRDGRLLFGTRAVRLFAYGLLSVVLALYLAAMGLTEVQIGLLLSLTLAGDVVISLWITSVADRVGRRRMLLLGSFLMIFAGLVFAFTGNIALLTIAAVIGTISPSGNEVGPFLAIEQAALAQIVEPKVRTQIFAWYSLVGSLATALGALFGGALVQVFKQAGRQPLEGYRAVVICYALLGAVLGLFFTRLSASSELSLCGISGEEAGSKAAQSRLGLGRSRRVVLKLSILFMVDAFAGGLIVQSLVAYWFSLRFGVSPILLGGIFFGANIFAGISALASARIADRFGLINTMVWTHIPSSILLMLVPLMPNLPSAIGALLARFSISQMDVPTRQSYTMAIVESSERSAAAGITNVARTAASAVAPMATGTLFGAGFMNVPFYICGALKILYDLVLYRNFQALKPPEES